MLAVTGAAGFIGSALVWALNQDNYDDILLVDTLQKDERWKNLVNLKFTDFIGKDDFIVRLECGDFDDMLDGILHMGACSSTTETDADFLLTNNYEYSRRLALWSMEQKKRFVYASSAATYGDGSRGFSDNHATLQGLKPLNMYGYSKQLMDLWAYRNNYLDTIAGLKFFNVFGPNEYHKSDMRSVVHKAFGQIMEKGRVNLFKSHRSDYEDGKQLRDFLYVKDAVKMTLFIYSNPEVNGIFNIGTGKARSFADLVIAVFHSMNREPAIDYIDMPETLREKYQYFTQADISKLHNAGYDKEITCLEDGIEDYVTNYLLTDDPHLGKAGAL